MQLAECLLVILPIPTIVVGGWSLRGLNRKDHRHDFGHAVFGILVGVLSIVAALLLLLYGEVHFDLHVISYFSVVLQPIPCSSVIRTVS